MKKSQIFLIATIVIIALAYFLIPDFQGNVNDAIGAISSANLEDTVEYIRSYGSLAAVISFILMILQSIISPIPAFLITLSNAAIFGWVNGAILSWTSSMVGAAMCFYIARILGRDVVVKFTSETALQSLDGFFDKYGRHTILVARLLPFMSFDLVSYAAGLTSMKFWPFFWATGLGQLPATILYSYIGQNLTQGGQRLFLGLSLLFAVSIVIYVGKKIYDDRQAKKAV